MSTNAESALAWLDESKPNIDDIKAVILKLEERIRRADPTAHDAGSIEALELLQQVISDTEVEVVADVDDVTIAVEPVATEVVIDTRGLTTDAVSVALDISPLGDPATITSEDLSPEARKARFLALKKQLSQS